MCGIAGILGASDPGTVRRMLATLAHRGPDDEHVEGGADFTLGARRLAILDLEGGRQPIADESGRVWAAQNGEIYNYPDLSRELLERGHRLRTRCDTEVLPHLWEENGADLVDRVDGMFAIAVWDDERKTGLLARDRFGKKPLYWCTWRGALAFASEPKALLRLPGFERRINLEAFHHYLGYKHVPHPLSIFEGIFSLPPAHRLVFRPGELPRIEPYWRLDFTPDETSTLPEEELVDRLLDLLREGVRRRFLSDVPIGFFLSGGIDSSLSTAIAAELSPRPIQTFTLTYAAGAGHSGKDEDRRWAREVARRYRTEHHEETVEAGDFPEQFRRILRCFDEPFAGVVSTWFLASRIARHVKVALSGDGADEVFGSYLSHRLAAPLAAWPEFRRTGERSLVRPFEDDPELLARLHEDDDWAWRAKLLVFDEAEKRALYAPDVAAATAPFSTVAHLRAAFADLTAVDPLNRILEAELQTIFPDQVLAFVDRLSMAHGLEVRTAYLDTALVRFVARLPGSVKIRDGDTKWLLKRAALRYLPEALVTRRKEGFVMPVTDWLTGDLRGWVRETLSPDRLRRHGLLDAVAVGRVVEDAFASPQDWRHGNKLLSLLAFQEWYDAYLA